MRQAPRELPALAGFTAAAVPDGPLTPEGARPQPPDLVILHHLMPGLDGMGVLERLQADPHLRGIPVPLLSGATESLRRASGLTAMVKKPFRLHAFQATVRSILHSRPAS